MKRTNILMAFLLILAVQGVSAQTTGTRALPKVFQAQGASPHGIKTSVRLGPLPATERLKVTIGLPLRNQEQLDALRQQLHDPASPLYHQWITPETFTVQFGPTAEEYAKVVAWAEAKGLEVMTAPNRLLLNVAGETSAIESAFAVTMSRYQHPSGITFQSPDRVPTMDLDVAIDTINGLNDLIKPVKRMTRAQAVARAGSGPQGSFFGTDLRKAYAAGVPSTVSGSGQSIALFEFSEDYAVDISNYFNAAGIPLPTITVVPVAGGVTPNPGNGNDVYFGQDEACVDIEVAGAMAPGASIHVYEGDDGTTILNQIANDNICKSVGVSWGWISDNQTSQTSIDPTQDAVFKQMDAQGIACFVASGDSGPWTSAQWNDPFSDPNLNPINPSDVPYITCVGATNLVTTALGAWSSETPWNDNNGESTGGPSLRYAMPSYQSASGIPWASVTGASTSMRNCPDVTANGVYYYVTEGNGKTEYLDGSSCSTPLWAAFTALVNQTSMARGEPVLGNLNPLLYAVGAGSSYATSFHDITSGSDGFPAAVGFDMATGWGSPVGQTTINALIGKNSPRSLDINQDGVVDVLDLAALAATYGSTTALAADLNNDGTVDDLDIILWLKGFGGLP